VPDAWTVDDVVAFYREETGAADAVLDAATSFDLAGAAGAPDDAAVGGGAPA